MNKETVLDVVVIGAGHSGLGVSENLKRRSLSHVVLEKHKIGNSWSTQRWNSFRLNTPNRMNVLPDSMTDFADQDGFCSADEFVSFLRDYAASKNLPIVEHAEVTSIERSPVNGEFTTTVYRNGENETFLSRNVVVASGSQNVKVVPDLASGLHNDIEQFHAGEFRNSEQLPEGAVLVVGSGQSGVQIAEDLLDAGRNVYLSTSRVARVPRRYRGRDIMDWMEVTGFLDHRPEDLPDPTMKDMRQAQVSGVGARGKTVSLQSLAMKGAVICGKLKALEGFRAEFSTDAGSNVAFGDTFSTKVKNIVDGYIEQSGVSAPPSEIDADDQPDENLECVSNLTSIDLREHSIATVVWATGFTGDYNYLKLPVLDEEGLPLHDSGVSEIPGLFFIGLPWLRTRKSGIVLGIQDDAQFICDQLIS